MTTLAPSPAVQRLQARLAGIQRDASNPAWWVSGSILARARDLRLDARSLRELIDRDHVLEIEALEAECTALIRRFAS